MLRTARSHTPKGCLTLGSHPARFPRRRQPATGLLAATRTGPSPARDNELVDESRCSNHRPPPVWAHGRDRPVSDLVERGFDPEHGMLL